jgi:uncharacterized protein (DUF1684 family)
VLLERDRRQGAAVQAESMAYLSVDEHRLALDHADVKAAANFSFNGVDLHDIEDERVASAKRLPADPAPLAHTIFLHDHIREDPERAVAWYRYAESLVASSICHAA